MPLSGSYCYYYMHQSILYDWFSSLSREMSVHHPAVVFQCARSKYGVSQIRIFGRYPTKFSVLK